MVSPKVIVFGTVMLGGCSLLPPTEHAAPVGTINKWQPTCTNSAIERRLFRRNLNLLQEKNLEQDAIAREKTAILNQKLLDSDDLCGSRSRR